MSNNKVIEFPRPEESMFDPGDIVYLDDIDALEVVVPNKASKYLYGLCASMTLIPLMVTYDTLRFIILIPLERKGGMTAIEMYDLAGKVEDHGIAWFNEMYEISGTVMPQNLEIVPDKEVTVLYGTFSKR